MSWTADTPTQGTYGSTAPFTVAHTCSANAKLLVVVVFVNGTTARAGGALTYNGATMTDSGQGFVFDTGGECGVEVWYLVDPDTGSSYTVSAPNTGGVNMDLSVMSFVPSAGGAAYDNSNSASGTTQNPSLSLTVSATGNLIVGGLGSGDRDVPTAGTNFTLIHTDDAGNQTWGSEYDLAGEASPVTVAFGTARGDDWGLIGISFAEAVGNINISSISDGATVADSPTIDPLILEGVSQSDGITLGDTPTMSLQAPTDFEIGVSDGATVADSPTITPLVLPDVAVSDGITLGDSGSASVEGGQPADLEIDVNDGATVADATGQLLVSFVSASEDVTLADIVRYYPDDVFIGESVAVSIESGAPADLEVNVSDGATVADSPTLVKTGWPEAFELDIGSWLTTQDTSGTGSTVTQSSTQAEGGTYSARCFTTNSGAKAQVRNAAFDSPWSGVPSANPGEHYWQRFSIFVPAATASAITGSEYVDIGGAYNSGGTDGYFLRLMEGAALYVNGPGSSGQATFNLYATLPTDQWVSIELGLWSQATGDLDRAFAVLIDGAFYGWFTNGKDATDYDRLAGGIVNTNSTDDLIVYIDNFYLYTTDAAPTGTDNRPTGSQYTLDYTTQSGENVGYHYTTWENGYTLNATYGLQPSSRIQSGAELSNLDSLVDGWSLIEMQWQDGATPSWPPVGTGDYYCPMIAFHKSVELEENLEITFKYRSGTGTTDLVYQSWTLSGTEYATWQVPDDHVTGESQPGQGDMIRVYWEEVSATEIHVVADYYDASADTWYLAIVDDTRALNNVNSVDFLDGDHLAVTNTIDSGDYAITYQIIGTEVTYGFLVSESDGVTVGDSASVSLQAPTDFNISVSDGVAVADSPTVSVPEIGAFTVSVSDGATVADSPTLDLTIDTSASDGITLGESATADLQVEASASDGITLGEAAALDIALEISASDGLTVADSTTIDPLVLKGISVSDGLAVGDTATVVRQVEGEYNVTVGDGATVADPVNLEVSGPQVIASDSVSVGESTQEYIGIEVSAAEALTVGEDATANLGLEISAADGVAVADSATVAIAAVADISINVSDDVAIGDTAQLDVSDPQVSASDALTIGESATVFVGVSGILYISVSDNAVVADSASADVSDPQVSASDNLAVGDVVTVFISEAGAIDISVSDTANVSDTASVRVSAPQIIASESLSIGESAIVQIGAAAPVQISVSDSLVVADAAQSLLGIDVSEQDNVIITDGATAIVYPIHVIASDGLIVGEAINVTSVEVVWVIIDDFELHGGVVISDDDAYNVTVVDYET